MLPVVVITPLVGIALVYLLETQVLLASVSNELMGQATLMANATSDQTGIWSDTGQAHAFVTDISPQVTARIMILDSRGYVMASSAPGEGDNVSRPLDHPGVVTAMEGQPSLHVDHRAYFFAEYITHAESTEIADALVPVMGPDQQVVGIIRLTQQLAHIHDRFLELRRLIITVLVVGLLLSLGVGWVLALNLSRPLQQATQAVSDLTSGERSAPLPEQGPDEIRLLLRAVNTLDARLRAAEQARRQLLANLVHELGRPLGALRSAIQALLGGAHQDEVLHQELLVGMDGEVGRLQRLLDDLARLYDQELGSLELNRQSVDLAHWLPGVLAPWREAARSKGLKWEVTIENDVPTLSADPDRLAQALGNLLSNANKYTPPGGAVSITVGAADDAVWIRVGDTGPGIEPDEMESIFIPFYHGRTGGRFPQGMGLGLSIARDLVAAHSGRLEVDSQPGHGSRFTIWLPVPPDDSSVPR
jgi:signal transduction histidine kinase